MRKAKTVASKVVTVEDVWGRVLEAMPRELGFSAEPLPSAIDMLRFRVHGPTTTKHRIGHADYEYPLKGVAAWAKALRAELVLWAREDRL